MRSSRSPRWRLRGGPWDADLRLPHMAASSAGVLIRSHGPAEFDPHSALWTEVLACHASSWHNFEWVPASPRCAGTGSGLTCAPQAVTASPAALATLIAAFMSRSSHTPHHLHCQTRMCRGFGPSFTPHVEHTCEVGSSRPIRWNPRLYSRALYSS